MVVLHYSAAALVLAMALLAPLATFQADPTVTTSLGPIRGFTSSRLDSFLGIQYAEVGERFARSTPMMQKQPLGINATSFGPSCYQIQTFGEYWNREDEECLYLNIWRPANTSSTSSLQVMVWIHGGGFMIDSGAEPQYDGSNLAREHNVIVVTINYRLGLFGFLVTGENGYGGMNGIHDQINALTWIQKHIPAFGGDPTNVMLFGESAGGISTCWLSVSPLARDLFRRAIIQSGECAMGNPPNDAETGSNITESLLTVMGASSILELTDATLFPAERLARDSLIARYEWTVSPTIDSWVLPNHPSQLYSDPDNIIPTDMIIGSVSYDDQFLLVVPPEVYVDLADNMEAELHDRIVPGSEAVMDAYSPDTSYNGNQVAAYAQYHGDVFFRCPSREFAAFVSSKLSGNIFLYNIAHLTAIDPINLNGLADLAGINDSSWTTHGVDIPMVFRTFTNFSGLWNQPFVEPFEADLALSTEIADRWVSFARSGNPNTANYGGWTPVPQGQYIPGVATSISTMTLEKNGGRMAAVDKKAKQCGAFSSFFVAFPSENQEEFSSAPSSMTTLLASLITIVTASTCLVLLA